MKSFKLRKEFVSAHPDIAEQLESKDYDFFDTEKHCKSGIILLGLGGSHAYGTNIETSDIDIRGVALNTPDEILGNHSFEVFTEKNTDTTIYSINKFIKLCADCNPNVIELLGLRNEDYLYISDLGQYLLDNVNLFVSKKMEVRFCGFAYSQLCRIKKFCSLQQQDEWEIGHLKKSIELSMENLNRMLPLENSRLVLEQEDGKLYMTGSFEKVPMDDVESIFHTIHSVNQSFHSLGAKNKKEGDRKLSKHMLNLIRLYAMGIDVLKYGKIITYREKEHDLLMDIRNNRFVKDMTVDPSFFELAEKYSQEFEEARKNTRIPDKPDWNEIEKLTMFFNRESLKM